ncbi:hypothetical protein ABZ468_06750 [Streptomyces sp. NPDC005708]|uniref:hypothetical protein n=1 Tax=unclassified Streptomyces TaxID=2593676 RepID=UPI0033DAB340
MSEWKTPRQTCVRIWDNRGRRWWGDLYELCPDGLVAELNGQADHVRITALMKRYRAQKR